jgi:dTMP kinase
MSTGEQFPGWYSRIEGPDGAGKTSILNLAREYAAENNIDVDIIREPGTGTFGEEMRNYLLHSEEHHFTPQTEYMLFTANRTHLVSDLILPNLKAGKTTISDRGIESSAAMQGGRASEILASMKGGQKGLSTEAILEIGRLVLPDFYMRPNGLVLLSLSKEVRRARMGAKHGLDKIEQRTMEYSDAVHDGYIALEALPHATVIDAEQDPAEVFKQARPILFGPEHA